MKRIVISLLCLMLILIPVLVLVINNSSTFGSILDSGLGNILGSPRSPAEVQCEQLFAQIRQGEGIAKQLLSGNADGGIMKEVMASVSYELVSQQTEDDGSIRCTLEITAIDMQALLQQLPDDLGSKEDARNKMLAQAKDAKRTTFEATIFLIPSGEKEEFDIRYDGSFVNAITGGMLEMILEVFDMEVGE